MQTNSTRLTAQSVSWAALGGSILGGGGGGSADTGAQTGNLAVEFSDLRLTPIDVVDPDAIIVTASMVGAPAAKEKYVSPADLLRCVELFTQKTGLKPGGIVTNENGGGSTFNGWLQASVLGIPLLDAPCNGRAHPTGVMGSLNLHRDPSYVTTMTCVGGREDLGRHVECTVTGSITHCSKLVRASAVEAGGLVAVVRNPVSAQFLRENSALGGLSHAIETGRCYAQGLERSVDYAVHAVADFLGGQVLTRGTVEDYQLRSEGGFDVGTVKVCGYEMSFWNEYMTVDGPDGERMGTFPDLIMTFDAQTGRPTPTSDLAPGQEIYLIRTSYRNLKLSAPMFDKELLAEVASSTVPCWLTSTFNSLTGGFSHAYQASN